jgi:hypothetical protein
MAKISEYLLEAKNKGYHVDKNGNVFSVNKQISLAKHTKNNYSRYEFTIRYYGMRVVIPVHKLVAYLKYGDEIFKNGIEIRHSDGNSLNNAWDNILIGTHSENMQDIPKINLVEKALTASKNLRRFSDEEVKKIVADRKSGFTYKMLCEKYNTSKSTLSYLFNDAYYSGKRNVDQFIIL